MESSWWQRLEQELEQQFDRFLSDHPNQKELLDQEHWNEQQRRKQQRLLNIDQEAQQLRQHLLKLFKDISAWSERVKRAHGAGAHDLAGRAQTHLSHLMGQGRAQWQALAALGEEAQRLKQELAATKTKTPKTETTADLEEAWSRFEADQELDEMRRQKR
jgi:hercynine metabolism protein